MMNINTKVIKGRVRPFWKVLKAFGAVKNNQFQKQNMSKFVFVQKLLQFTFAKKNYISISQILYMGHL